MTTKVQYGLRTPAGELLRVSKHHNNDGDCCSEYTYQLSESPDDPEWLVDDPQDVAMTLMTDVQWYNSKPTRPCWTSRLDPESLTAVKVTTVVKAEDFEIKVPVMIQSGRFLDCRDILPKVAALYTGTPMPAERYVFCVVNYPLAEMQARVGESIYWGSHTSRVLAAAVPVPEEWQPECDANRKFNSGGCCLLICEAA